MKVSYLQSSFPSGELDGLLEMRSLHARPRAADQAGRVPRAGERGTDPILLLPAVHELGTEDRVTDLHRLRPNTPRPQLLLTASPSACQPL